MFDLQNITLIQKRFHWRCSDERNIWNIRQKCLCLEILLANLYIQQNCIIRWLGELPISAYQNGLMKGLNRSTWHSPIVVRNIKKLINLILEQHVCGEARSFLLAIKRWKNIFSIIEFKILIFFLVSLIPTGI